MAGSRSDSKRVCGFVVGYSNAAVTAGQVLIEATIPCGARIGGIVGTARTAGVGAGNTVLDVLRNNTSIWSTAGNRPTLASASTGDFASTVPEVRSMQAATAPFDYLILKVISIPATTGHARVSLTVALEEA